MEPPELRIEESDVRALIDRLVLTGAPQDLDTLTEWFVRILVQRES